MRRFRAYVQPLMVWLSICMLLITVGLYLLSNRLVSNSYAGLSRQEVSQCVKTGQQLLSEYDCGIISLEELHDAVNPSVNPAEVFLLLVDANGSTLCFTDTAEDVLAGLSAQKLVRSLTVSDSPKAIASDFDSLLLMGQLSSNGAVIAGKSLSAYTSALAVFRGLLLRYFIPLAILLLAVSMYLSHVMSKPADILVDAAFKISEGELVHIDQPLPHDLKPIAQAFNHMSQRLSSVLGEIGYERDMLSLVLESLHEGVMAIDSAGDKLHENRAARLLLGGENSAAYHEVTEMLKQAITQTTDPKKLQLGEKTLLVRFSPLPVRQNQRQGAIAMILDITEAERLDRTRRDYVANISHELRTPLASMRGIAEALRDGLVSDEAERNRYDNMIVSEIRRLSRLVNDLLELSSLQSNPAAFETEPVDPAETLYELYDRTKRLAESKEVSLQLSIQEGEVTPITTNEDRLQQVLTILLDNAIKFTPSGGQITLGFENMGYGLRFYVRDTGIGMDAETRDHCFDRFRQGDKSHRASGSGLGLAIAREIMDHLGAKIVVHSEVGHGSEFSFILRKENQKKEGTEND